MEDERLDLGLVDALEAVDVGEPGKRTFKITASSERGQATVWMEKEQLFQIGLSIHQFIATDDARPDTVKFEPEYPAPPAPGSAEFKTSELRIRHDSRTDVFTVEAIDPESESEDDDEEPSPAVQFSFSRSQAQQLAEEALQAVSKGRPRCELCGGPKDSDGHVCPKSNGHHKGDFELA